MIISVNLAKSTIPIFKFAMEPSQNVQSDLFSIKHSLDVSALKVLIINIIQVNIYVKLTVNLPKFIII